MDFLYLLESIRNPVLTAIFSTVTHLGEELLFIVVAMILLWCVDKFEAYFMLFTGFLGVSWVNHVWCVIVLWRKVLS